MAVTNLVEALQELGDKADTTLSASLITGMFSKDISYADVELRALANEKKLFDQFRQVPVIDDEFPRKKPQPRYVQFTVTRRFPATVAYGHSWKDVNQKPTPVWAAEIRREVATIMQVLDVIEKGLNDVS